MKKILFSVLLLCSCMVSAADWKEHWLDGVEACKNKDYWEAEKNFSLAIEELESVNDNDHFHIYVDRGRLYLLIDKYSDALNDFDKALSSEKLDHNDLIRALTGRINACSNLGKEKEVLEDLERFGKLYCGGVPSIEKTEKHLIIRNLPKDQGVIQVFNKYLVNCGMCDSEKDIHMLDSGVCIVDRSSNSQSETCKKKVLK